MADQVENLVLEHLKRIQATLEDMRGEMRELRIRQTETHTAVVSLRRDQAYDAEISAHLQVQLDTVKDRLATIERRLELSN